MSTLGSRLLGRRVTVRSGALMSCRGVHQPAIPVIAPVNQRVAAGHILCSCKGIVLAASHLDNMYLPHIPSLGRYLRGKSNLTGISFLICSMRWTRIGGTETKLKSGECAKQLLVKCCTYLLMQLVDEN
jgi:hypothetical protein